MDWLARRATDVCLVLGAALLIGIGVSSSASERPIEGGVLTSGEIVEFVTRTGSDDSETRFPVIQFTDRYERTRRFEPEVVTNGFGLEGKVGQVVKVRYDPADPARAQWADQPGRWLTPVTIGLGIVLLVAELGLVARRALRRRGARGEAAAARP